MTEVRSFVMEGDLPNATNTPCDELFLDDAIG
jgi:hypothetical protein